MKKKREGDIDCCKDPPSSCPRRYCAIAMRALEQGVGAEDTPKKRGEDETGDKNTSSNRRKAVMNGKRIL